MKKIVFLVAALSLIVIAINFTHAQTDAPKNIAVYYADGKPVTNPHIVVGQISLPAGSSNLIEEFPVTLASGAAFTSGDSYKCFAAKPFGASFSSGGLFRIIDGSHFAFRTSRFGPAWQQDFFCIGN